ncbi:MAG: hypothetical protein ACP5L5_11405 [Vulcanisaeta sp.]|uniref:hypothetical protein n=1 Tax=Vulcanisaeta sp. TaxID=2020871 RepID=UPI003D14B537
MSEDITREEVEIMARGILQYLAQDEWVEVPSILVKASTRTLEVYAKQQMKIKSELSRIQALTQSASGSRSTLNPNSMFDLNTIIDAVMQKQKAQEATSTTNEPVETELNEDEKRKIEEVRNKLRQAKVAKPKP